jgi:Uncharacterised nucleotidyltransferase
VKSPPPANRIKSSTQFASRSAETSNNLTRSRLLLGAVAQVGGDAMKSWNSWCVETQLQPLSSELLLMPLIYAKLAKLSGEGVPVTGLELLRRQYMATWMQNEMTVKAFAGVSELFDAAGIDHVVLKGVALASDRRMGDLALRPFVDVDLLVRPANYRDSIEVLLRQGWVASAVDPSVHIDAHHSINLRLGNHGSIDLHREPLHRSHHLQEDDAMWGRSELSHIGKLQLRIPAISDHIVTVIGHSWVGDVRAAADLFYLFSEATERDLAMAIESLDRRSMVLHSRRVVEQMQGFFPEHEFPIRQLLRARSAGRPERLRDALEYPTRLPDRSAQWSRQLAYWLNRSQGDSIRQRSRTFYSFALFNTGTTKLWPAVRVALQSLRLGERTGDRQ